MSLNSIQHWVKIAGNNEYWTLTSTDYSARTSKGSSYITYDIDRCVAQGDSNCNQVGIRPVIQIKL